MMEIRLVEVPERRTAAVRRSVAPDAVARTYPLLLEEVSEGLRAVGLHPSGSPYVRHHGGTDLVLDVEVGFPFRGDATPAHLVTGALPSGHALEAVHTGGHDLLPDVHAAMWAWATTHGVRLAEQPWHVLECGPQSDPDEATWRTRVVWPLVGGAHDVDS